MELKGKRIILTGAAGGIGQHVAQLLAKKGANLMLIGLTEQPLKQLMERMDQPEKHHCLAVDLSNSANLQQVVDLSIERLGGIDMLINNAGLLSFNRFSEEDPAAIEQLYRVNLLAPVLLTRAVLPHMLKNGCGNIVNIGSIFGSIAFSCFATYSSSKFGIRGFSEALRRELEESAIKVSYIAPRATRTPLNNSAVYRMSEAVKMPMDSPELVARQIVAGIECEAKDLYLGNPESLFVRLNALLPRLVDRALRKQNRIMQRFV
ncbi:MAG: SDR family oxidoreductase [Gammaproteobacteria bacterium]|nr:SDR family oxidoreductase [Gammaproteobacteria bacterium]